jgi:hypothetical protein
MAKFRKVIGRPGVFRVNTPNGKEIKALTKDFWKSVYTTAKDIQVLSLLCSMQRIKTQKL